MNYEVTRSNERGGADHGWLKANHYFSFGSYYDPSKISFGKLRVINDDLIAPGRGFATHPHDNMEIITIPLSGAVKHKDSEGNEGVVPAGDVQVMSAGSGITHSEHNNSSDEELSLFQIWIESSEQDVKPRYDQKTFKIKTNEWTQLIRPLSSSNEEGLGIHQDAYISMAKIDEGHNINYKSKISESGIYLISVSGVVAFEDESLNKRDAVALTEVESLSIKAIEKAQILVIETSIN